MSETERVMRKGDSAMGYPLSPRPNSLYQSVMGIPGVKGTWDLSTTARQDIRKSVKFGIEWINEQSGHSRCTLVLPWRIAGKVADSQEMREAAREPGYSVQSRGIRNNYQGVDVYIAEVGQTFHATAVPMLVAPSVERPLWKVVFTDAIGEEKASHQSGPGFEALYIGGPLDGDLSDNKSPAPSGYSKCVENIAGTRNWFLLHDSVSGIAHTMHILRDHYAKTKKTEVAEKVPPQAECCLCKFWEQVETGTCRSNTKGQCKLTDADVRITRIASCPGCWCFMRKPMGGRPPVPPTDVLKNIP